MKAKDASVAARSQSSSEALLSGDGELMTSVLSNCFSDPKYVSLLFQIMRQPDHYSILMSAYSRLVLTIVSLLSFRAFGYRKKYS